MPYTNAAINLATPADNTVAGLGDDRIRELKLDLKERIESIIANWDADPWVLKAQSVPLAALINGDLPAGVKVKAANIPAKEIPTAALADLLIGNGQLAIGATRSRNIADSNNAAAGETAPAIAEADVGIMGRHLDSAILLERHFTDDSIGTGPLKADAVETANIKDLNVTKAKLAVAVTDGLWKQLTGTLAIAAANGGITAQRFREWDVNVPGATVGCRCEARYEPSVNGSSGPNGGVPSPAGTAAINADTGLIDHDTVHHKAWCVEVDKVRCRIINPTNVNCPAEARTLRAYAFVPA